MTKTLILNSQQIQQKINRIAYEIYENNYDEKEIIVAGIANNGFILAKYIVAVLQNISPIKKNLIKLAWGFILPVTYIKVNMVSHLL